MIKLKYLAGYCEVFSVFEESPGSFGDSDTVFAFSSVFEVSVAVDSNNIKSISLENMTDSVETMYPLVEPAMNELVSKIVQNQSTDNISYANTSQYTSKVLQMCCTHPVYTCRFLRLQALAHHLKRNM